MPPFAKIANMLAAWIGAHSVQPNASEGYGFIIPGNLHACASCITGV